MVGALHIYFVGIKCKLGGENMDEKEKELLNRIKILEEKNLTLEELIDDKIQEVYRFLEECAKY